MAHLPHTLAASYLILLKEDQILLQRRFQTGFMDGMYSLPAGHIESKESATQTLIREIKEEIGVELLEENLSVVHIMHRYSDIEHQYIDIFYTTKNWDGEPMICEPEKCDDLSWFSMNSLPENLIPYIRTVLERVGSGIMYSEYGWNQNI